MVIPLALCGQAAAVQDRPSDGTPREFHDLLHSARTYGDGPKMRVDLQIEQPN